MRNLIMLILLLIQMYDPPQFSTFLILQDWQLLSLYVLVHIDAKDNFVQCIEAVPETIELFGFF